MKILNGYRASHRNRWKLLQENVLNFQEFNLFEYYLDTMDFDQKHKDKFGTFEVYFDEICIVFNKQRDTVKDWHSGLLQKGFIVSHDAKRNLFKIKSPLRYITGEVWGGKATEYAKQEKITSSLDFLLENVCFSPENLEKKPKFRPILDTNNTTRALGSFNNDVSKGSSDKVVVIRQEPRSTSEYEKIKQEGNFQDLTVEDMR